MVAARAVQKVEWTVEHLAVLLDTKKVVDLAVSMEQMLVASRVANLANLKGELMAAC